MENLKDELEEILSIPEITPSHLQHEKMGLRYIQDFEKLRSDKSSTDGYVKLLKGFARSSFRDFESYLRILIGLNEDIIQLVLKY